MKRVTLGVASCVLALLLAPAASAEMIDSFDTGDESPSICWS